MGGQISEATTFLLLPSGPKTRIADLWRPFPESSGKYILFNLPSATLRLLVCARSAALAQSRDASIPIHFGVIVPV